MPLPDSLLMPLEALLNRRIAAASPAHDLCADLEGRTLVIDPTEAPAIAFTVVEGALRLSFEVVEQPNAIVSGPLLELTRFAQAGSLEAARDVEVNVQGDVRTAGGYASLFAIARPDFEAELSRLVGDLPAHQLGSAMRGLGDFFVRAGSTLQRDLSDFLKEESRDVPPRDEVQRFEDRLTALSERIDSLRERVEAMGRR